MKFFAEIKPKEGAFLVPAVSVVDAGKPSEALNQVISSWFADQDISPEGDRVPARNCRPGTLPDYRRG
jgi:hypothetical protein